MRLLQVYNQYRSLFNGEDLVVRRTAELLQERGHHARLWTRSSRGIEHSITRRLRAFWSGIYSPSAYAEMARLLDADRPDVVHVHNLYPLFSPSILLACRRAGVPVVMSVHNLRMTCPKSDHLHKGRICERCLGGREYYCALLNCRENIFESTGYAIRSAVARKWRFFRDNVSMFIAVSQFGKQRLIDPQFDEDRIVVVPNMSPHVGQPVDPTGGRYVAFAGRMSPEKGIDTLLEATSTLPHISVQLAGSGPVLAEVESQVPAHVRLRGQLESDKLTGFYRGARMLVLPSRTFEMCPLSILEAMSHGLPVIASRLGGQAELVEDGVTGLLFTPGDPDDLAAKIQLLWKDSELCRRLGRAGYEKVVNEYREDVYFRRLMGVYEQATAQQASKFRADERAKDVSRQGERPVWEQPFSVESE